MLKINKKHIIIASVIILAFILWIILWNKNSNKNNENSWEIDFWNNVIPLEIEDFDISLEFVGNTKIKNEQE